MKRVGVFAVVSIALAGLLGSPARSDDALTVAKGSVTPGDGQSVTFKGSPLPLAGNPIKLGQPLPASTLTGGNMAPVNIAEPTGKVRIISVVPSLDTPTCDAQTHELSEKDPALANIEMVTVSMDLPFAQKRWCGAAGVDRVKTLSDFRGQTFSQNYGVLLKDGPLAGVDARAVFVVGKDGKVKYVEYVSEIANEPNYEATLAAAKAAAGA